MKAYLDILQDIMTNGVTKVSAPRGLRKESIETRSLFCQTFRHDMSQGFPLITTRRMHWKGIVEELKWFLSGEKKLPGTFAFWDKWKNENDEIPSAYGVRWRKFPAETYIPKGDDGYGHDYSTFDQIRGVVELLRKDPSSRRGVVVAWDPREDLTSDLPPCHYTFVVNVINEKVNLHCTMRSTDAPVGLPTNIASYALLLKCFSSWLGKEPGELAITCVDIHVYSDQYQLVSEQLKRGPMFLCQVSIDTDPEKLQLLRADRINYQSWPTIDYPVAL